MIVADASAVTDYLLGREAAVRLLERAMAGRENEPLHAPELVEPETVNALRRLLLAGEIDEPLVSAALERLGLLRIVRYPHAPLRARVWALRANLSAYDAEYVALAEALDAEQLITADGGMAAAARALLGHERVLLIE